MQEVTWQVDSCHRTVCPAFGFLKLLERIVAVGAFSLRSEASFQVVWNISEIMDCVERFIFVMANLHIFSSLQNTNFEHPNNKLFAYIIYTKIHTFTRLINNYVDILWRVHLHRARPLAHNFPQSLKREAVLQLFDGEAQLLGENWLPILLLLNNTVELWWI